MTKRDSIEFLWDELKPFLPKSYTEEESIKILSILKQAKLMHKEEIMQAWKMGDGKFDNVAKDMSWEYYNETFGGNNEQL